MVQLFPNWLVRHVRSPQLRTASWLSRPVEVFLVSPKMTKLEIKEYLCKLYNLPVTKVHTANYLGKRKTDQMRGTRFKMPDFKKAFVYLRDEQGAQRPRYHEVEAQLTDEAQAAWPARPNRVIYTPGAKRPPKDDAPRTD